MRIRPNKLGLFGHAPRSSVPGYRAMASSIKIVLARSCTLHPMNPKALTTSENLIEFRDVFFSVHRGATGEIISGVSLAVPHGETLVLLRRSGSGKTPLLKLINGMLAPTRGEALVQQRRTTDWNLIQLRRSIGYVIQDAGLFPHFT